MFVSTGPSSYDQGMKDRGWLLPIVTAFPALLCAFCSPYGKIEVIRDDFKNSTVVTMVLEQSSEKGYRSLRTRFSRIIPAAGEESVTLRVNLTLDPGDAPMTTSVFLQTDDAKHELELVDRLVKSHSETYTHSRSATGFMSYHTYSWDEHSGEIDMPLKVRDAVKNSSTLLIRLYSGSIPYDFRFDEKELAKLKELLRYDVHSRPVNRTP